MRHIRACITLWLGDLAAIISPDRCAECGSGIKVTAEMREAQKVVAALTGREAQWICPPCENRVVGPVLKYHKQLLSDIQQSHSKFN